MDLPPLLEHTQLQLPHDDQTHHHVDFEDVVELIVPPAEPIRGRPRVELRKMSLPVSFISKPSEVDLDDPSFIPTQPRRLSIRLPSFTRSISPPPATTPSSSCLRSCLARTTSRDGAQPAKGQPIPSSSTTSTTHLLGPRIGRSRSLDPSSSGCSFASLLSSSSPSVAHLGPPSPPLAGSSAAGTSGSSLQQHVPRIRRRSSASSRPPSLPPSPGSPGANVESLLLPLRNCCAACVHTTDLALRGHCAEEHFSPGALKKRAEDQLEAARDAEMQSRWRRVGAAAVSVDEVQKKQQGKETGLREITPPAEEDEELVDEDNDEVVGRASSIACPVFADKQALGPNRLAVSPSAASWVETPVDYEPVFAETPLSTPATDETCASSEPSSSSLPLTPPTSPPLCYPVSLGPSSNTSTPRRPPPVVSPCPPSGAAPNGKKRFWSMSLGALPTFNNPFGPHGKDGGGTHHQSVAGLAGGHGRF